MKRNLVFLAVLFLSGCIGRTYVTDHAKLDFDVNSGERRAPDNNSVDKRKVLVWEIETGHNNDAAPKPKQETPNDTGSSSEPSQSAYESTPSTCSTSEAAPASDKTYTEYTVQKNDTLQKISKKFYGTTRKWHKIYVDNKDVLSAPDKVYPGLVIKVSNEK